MATLRLSGLLLLALTLHSGWAALCPYEGWQSYGSSCYYFYQPTLCWAALCPYGGWRSYGSSCYYFYNPSLMTSWSDAELRCQRQDADLVSIDNTHERDWILGQARRLGNYTGGQHHSYWIGLNVLPDASAWKGPNSTSVTMSVFNGKWANSNHNQPNKDRRYMCGEIKDLKFAMTRCSDTHQAICERPSTRALTCDPGWSLFGSACYKYFNRPQNFQGAKNTCHHNGGTLPVVTDADTETAVWDLSKTNKQNLWISLQSQQNGHSYVWRWDNGTTLTRPAFWVRTPPRSLGGNVNKTCVEQTQARTAARSWNPVACTSSRRFICQKPEGTCPNGWLQVTNRCYLIYTHSTKSFNDAKNFCSGMGAALASLDSSATTSFLYPYVHNARAAGAQTLWIGLTDNNKDAGPWQWTAGNRALGRWKNWVHNPATNTHGKQDCVTIDSNDRNLKWHPTPTCGNPHRFICQLPVNKAIQKPTPPPVHYTCPHGYHLYSPHQTCVQLNSADKSWTDARTACQHTPGGDLVTITDAAFGNYLKAQIRNHRGKYWIGLHDRHQENHFQWLDSNTNAVYTNWQHGEPNNFHGNENCVAIYDQNAYQWWDATCTALYHYICQVPAQRNGQAITTTTQKPWNANCGPMWESDPNSFSCYMFSSERLSWLDARQICQTNHGDLVSVNTVAEQFYINGRVRALNSNIFWVGANDRQTETGWRWSDQSAFAFINWNSGQPDNHGNSDCVGISQTTGRWSDYKCTDRYGYICEKIGKVTPRPTPALTTPAHIPHGKTWGCGRGWKGYHGQCYQFAVQNGVKWQAARVTCGQRAGALVSIHTSAENNFVKSLYPRGFNKYMWIGLNDLVKEGSFGWTDTSTVTYTNWNNHEPNDNMHKEDCVTFVPRGGWNDMSCDSRGVGGYVCKKPMALQNTADIAMLQGCPAGLGFRAQCYLYVSTPTKTWNDAQADCRHRHGNLATINDGQIQAFVSAELVNRGGSYWIGLKNPGGQNKTYVWTTKYDFDFTSWGAKHTGNEHATCVAMTTGRPVGLWANSPCNQHQPYICEVPRRGFTTPPPTPPSTPSRLPCPHGGWKGFSNACIKAFNLSTSDQLSWMESRSYCQSLGGDLLSIWGQYMESWIIRRILNNATQGVYWIGLNDRASEEGHVWSDDHGVTYTNWVAGEPNDYSNREDCVNWKFPDNGWNDDNCYITNNFICSVPRGTVVSTTAPPPTGAASSQCPNGTWTYLNGYCYYLSPQDGPVALQTWYQARRTCQHMGADLASVHSTDENGFLTSAMSRSSRWTFWIGLNDLDQSDISWTDGTPVNFISWNPNEPNDEFGEESCVESTSQGTWNDQQCQETNSYICKRPAGNHPRTTPTLPPALGGCPAGFTSLPILEKCFKLAGLTDATRKNFTDAATACTQMSPPSQLASVHNNIEQRYLTTLIATLPHFVWIGLNDRKHRNYFEWQDNSEVAFTHWGPGQPDENTDSNDPKDRRDCVGVNAQPKFAGNWNDMTCSHHNHYVCEVKRVPTLPTLQSVNTGCHSGYSSHLSNCYKFFPTAASWAVASATCKQDGGSLASLSDRFEAAVVGLLRMPDRKHARNVSDIWIGLTLPQGSKSFQWSSNWPLTYSRWANGEPDNTGACGRLDPQGFWHDHPCSTHYPFVCQISTGGPPATTPVLTGGLCPNSSSGSTWTPHGEFCYSLVTSSQRSWPEANYACQLQGANLASLHSAGDTAFLTSALFAQALAKGGDATANVWLGLSKGLQDGFLWSDGTEMEYDNWAAGEPSDTDSGSHQDCVQLSLADASWNDVDCFDPNYYLCKILKVVPSYQPPAANPLKQGNGNNNNNSNGGGMSGGAIAGVALGTIAVLVIVAIGVLLLRGQVALPSLPKVMTSASSGFDNALYNKPATKAANGQEKDQGSVQFNGGAESES